MSLLNLSLNLVSYADDGKSANPLVKFTDLSWSMLGLPTATPRMVPIALAPGETRTIMTLARTISYTGGTSFQIFQVPSTSNVRLIAPLGQRAARSDGDATTQWAVTLTNQIARFTYTGTGLAPVFGGIVAGDGITIDTPFSVQNCGSFTVLRVGVNYVEFENPFALAETVLGQVQIYSSGPVQIGDLLDISDVGFSYPNRGQFKVLNVTDSFIEFSNSEAIPETITGVTSGGVVIYPEAHQWMLLAIDRRVIVRCNGDTGSGVEVEPPTEGDLVKYPGLMLKRGKLFNLELTNPGLAVANGFVFLAE
jgi:hypothetical protein